MPIIEFLIFKTFLILNNLETMTYPLESNSCNIFQNKQDFIFINVFIIGNIWPIEFLNHSQDPYKNIQALSDFLNFTPLFNLKKKKIDIIKNKNYTLTCFPLF